MGTNQDTSTLKTLADAVTATAAAENVKTTAVSGSNGNRTRVSDVSTDGVDVNAAFDGGGAVAEPERVAHSETEVETRVGGPEGPECGSDESKGNGISLGFAGESDKKCGRPDSEESGREDRSGADKRFPEVNGSVSAEAQMGDNLRGGNGGVEDLSHGGRVHTRGMDRGKGGSDHAEYMEEMDGGKEGSDDVEYMEDHAYSVGDLVWGKIKSHPWWPGQIYDPSDASESAMKYNQKGRLLVAYFGDGSFAWCLPSQLIPFAENFENMSKQSSSKTFVNAVQEAVDEIGRLVELEMTCQCVPEKNRKGLSRPAAVNSGIKAGVLVPDGDIGKILSFRYDPAELLAAVEHAANSVSFANMLELGILKSWLSAFYRARGGHKLPVYYGPLQIEGLEDKNRNENLDINDFSVPIEVPIHRPLEEDWLSSAASGPGNGQAPQEDKMHHRRKQKSVAELLADGTSAKPKTRKRSSSGEGTNASNSTIKRQKFSDDDVNRTGSVQAASGRKRGRKKKDDTSQSGEPTASDATDGSRTEVKMQERSLSSKLGKDKITIPDTNDDEGMKGSEEMSSPRERKKSKYLSPPYTTPNFRTGNLGSKKEESEGESEKITGSARMGERMTKAAGKLLESPMCDGETVGKNLPEGQMDIGSQNGNPVQGKIIDPMDVNASASEVLSGIQSFAVNPLDSWRGSLLDLIGRFTLTFRRSMYVNGEYYKEYHKNRTDRKRKSLNSEPESRKSSKSEAQQGTGKGMQEKSGADMPKTKTSSKESIQEKSTTLEVKNAAGGSEKNAGNKEVDRKSPLAYLIVTFAPGSPLPSKDDVIRIFTKFGDLNEQETNVLPVSNSVQISYARSSDAEEALRASLRENPFGSGSVNFDLSYSSPAPEASDKPATTSESAADETTANLGSMREKLLIMTSMLEKCDGKISLESRSDLHNDIELLLKKIRGFAETASK